MLCLYETSAGYGLFKLPKKIVKSNVQDIRDTFFGSLSEAQKNCTLIDFQPFQDTADAITAITSCQSGEASKGLLEFLQKATKPSSSLAVLDKNLAVSLKNQSDWNVLHDKQTMEVFRGIREHITELLSDKVSQQDLHQTELGLSHSLGRYKLKFSADKVDTMIVQAVGLLDDLDKEINTYAMRVKEWYGWHFPELQALVSDNMVYAKLVQLVGHRPNFRTTDLEPAFGDAGDDHTDAIHAVKEAAELSMGTDITDSDLENIQSLAEQVTSMMEYRAQLFEYLKNRMNAMAPNLTILVGELVGARLIAHAGSLMNLAKQPASTIQILGAEKALFRALKTKSDTPKYGLIYHASLIGQAPPKHKGKISRVLAAKSALAVRVDALTEDDIDTTVGFDGRAKVEARLRQLDGSAPISNGTLTAKKTQTYNAVAAVSTSETPNYNAASDMQVESIKEKKSSKKKRKHDEDNDEKAAKKEAKKAKKAKKEKKKKSKE